MTNERTDPMPREPFDLDRVDAGTVANAIADAFRYDWPTLAAFQAGMTDPANHDPHLARAVGLLRRIIERYPSVAPAPDGYPGPFPCLRDEALAWWLHVVKPTLDGIRETAAAMSGAATPTTAAPDPTPRVVVNGPNGHWYAYTGGELVAMAQSAHDDPENPPPHPSTLEDDEALLDWYDPYDLGGRERLGVFAALGVKPDSSDGLGHIPGAASLAAQPDGAICRCSPFAVTTRGHDEDCPEKTR